MGLRSLSYSGMPTGLGGYGQKGSIGYEASEKGMDGSRYDRKAYYWRSWLDNVVRSLFAAVDDGNFQARVARYQ